MPNIFLLGRKGVEQLPIIKALEEIPDLTIHVGSDIDEVRSVFETATLTNTPIDHVFMGAGLSLDDRLDIVREVFERSHKTSVHLKEATTGPQGFLPFVRAVLVGPGVVA